ncbi:MAG: hypothetical protein OXF02_00590 [Simkaniaceae bacterium]|nr:hypothetical protein [Simkaniaceae bacterium]
MATQLDTVITSELTPKESDVDAPFRFGCGDNVRNLLPYGLFRERAGDR